MYMFIDVQGTLHPSNVEVMDNKGRPTNDSRLFCWMDKFLQTISKKRDLKIVLTTPWCMVFPLEKLQALFGEHADKVVAVLGNEIVLHGKNRVQQVKEYVAAKGIKDWVVVDADLTVMTQSAIEPKHFIYCKGTTGLSDIVVAATLRNRLYPPKPKAEQAPSAPTKTALRKQRKAA